MNDQPFAPGGNDPRNDLPATTPYDNDQMRVATEAEVVEGEVYAAAEDAEPQFTWQASEYIHHHKSAAWYAGLVVLIVIGIAVAVYLKQWGSIALILAMGAAVGVYAHRAPRVLTYKVDSHSIDIESKSYPYVNFRSFGVLSDIEWHSIELEPTKRLQPRITLLFGDDDYDTIVEHLQIHLPREDRDPDLIERITRFLRF